MKFPQIHKTAEKKNKKTPKQTNKVKNELCWENSWKSFNHKKNNFDLKLSWLSWFKLKWMDAETPVHWNRQKQRI